MQDHQLPPYLGSTGASPVPGPYQHDDSHIYTFYLNGCRKKIQHQLDISLNQVSALQGKTQSKFVAVTSLVMLQFAKLKSVYSLMPGFQEQGKMTETEVITWVLVAELDENSKVVESYWHPMYLWVDNATALTIGREIYGYPKRLGQAVMPEGVNKNLNFSLQVFEHQTYGINEHAKPCELLSVKTTGSKQSPQTASQATIGANFAKIMLGHGDNADLNLTELLPTIVNEDINQLFLKQFPDTTGLKAVYQAVVATRARHNNVHQVQLLPHNNLKLNLSKHDTLNLSETLGLTVGNNDVLMAFYMHVDFTTDTGKEIRRSRGIKKQKVAVIGGGMGSLATVFELTEQPNWQQKYDITLYQMGWRLGGKGASGRNAKYHQRIEEHGLHIWFGCYHNAFTMMEKVYNELERDKSHPHQSMGDAFKGRPSIALIEHMGDSPQDGYQTIEMNYPFKQGELGSGSHAISMKKGFQVTIETLGQTLQEYLQIEQATSAKLMRTTTDIVGSALSKLSPGIKSALPNFMPELNGPIKGLQKIIEGMAKGNTPIVKLQLAAMKPILMAIRRLVLRPLRNKLPKQPKLRMVYVNIDMSIAMIEGILKYQLFANGFDSINHLDFRKWLIESGADEKYTASSANVLGLYNLIFAYEDGDFNRPNCEAGTMLRSVMRMRADYKGSFMYEMQGGMGDVVFEPFYQVLKKRGVKFEFFSQVEDLTPSADNSCVQSITITSQLPNMSDYQPFVDVKGIKCWPSFPNLQAPNIGQLNEQQKNLVQEHYHQLETAPHKWKALYKEATGEDLPQKVLTQGEDFDLIIFGASLSSIPIVASKLVAADDNMALMVDKVKTCATQAAQTFSSQTLNEAGWQKPDYDNPITSGVLRPFDTWSVMNQLINYEDWSQDAGEGDVKSIHYHCCVMPFDGDEQGQTDQNQADTQVKTTAEQFIQGPFKHALPNFDHQQIFDDPKRHYYRANVYGSERYVLSFVGTSKYRLKTDGTRFNNLFLAGDWTQNGINIGCIEAAVTSGLMASRAICGFPIKIDGELDI